MQEKAEKKPVFNGCIWTSYVEPFENGIWPNSGIWISTGPDARTGSFLEELERLGWSCTQGQT